MSTISLKDICKRQMIKIGKRRNEGPKQQPLKKDTLDSSLTRFNRTFFFYVFLSFSFPSYISFSKKLCFKHFLHRLFDLRSTPSFVFLYLYIFFSPHGHTIAIYFLAPSSMSPLFSTLSRMVALLISTF